LVIELRPLAEGDVAAHMAGEDAAVIEWLTGAAATWDSTARHFEMLAANAARGVGKRGFGVWLDEELAGYVDFDPDDPALPEPGDVNIAYAVHPWARRCGVATEAVRLVCEQLRRTDTGKRAIIRTHPLNRASIGVARACGFQPVSAPILGQDQLRDTDDTSASDVIFALHLKAPGLGARLTEPHETVSPPRLRVAAYVLRELHSWELLVFEQAGHPQAGTQIPAGGVRPDETLEEAVMREVREETGLEGLRLRAQLVTEDKPHPLTGEPRSTTFFVIDVNTETPDTWEHLVRGEDADDGLIFVCRFVSLPLRRPLADHQDAWLKLIDTDFATSDDQGA
jgi:ADP-ribose pyrophosphatase YjhB (NUDIX family)/RimJ/RimL family protein N-acetyltransferase